jgi:perosamine synthetase
MIEQYRPFIGSSERTAMERYINTDTWLTEFKETHKFESMISEVTKTKHCSVVNNGTMALVLALLAVDIQPGDEVIVPDMTMIATANAVRLIGAIPVFADVSRTNLCLNFDSIMNKLTIKTKAIIYVSFNGRYNNYNVDNLLKSCRILNLKVIEDAAQSFGSYYNDMFRHSMFGTLGDIGCYSFSPHKIITTGQGGALVTNNDTLGNKIKRLKDFGRKRGGEDIHNYFGINSKFTDLQAVIGIEQLKKITSKIKKKRFIYDEYYHQLKDVDGIFMFKRLLNETIWFVDIYLDNPDDLALYLFDKHHINVRFMYPPIHTQKIYCLDKSFPVAEEFAYKGLWLPSSMNLGKITISDICTYIKIYMEKRSAKNSVK